MLLRVSALCSNVSDKDEDMAVREYVRCNRSHFINVAHGTNRYDWSPAACILANHPRGTAGNGCGSSNGFIPVH
jgi:hypothetical protein